MSSPTTLAVNGADLYVEQAGAGEPILFIHGFTLDTRMWDDQFDYFARSFHVIRYDLRGFGKSSPPDPARPYVHADDLAALLNALGLQRVSVVGLSLGGGIALDFACLHPERLAALVVIDSAMGGYPWSAQSSDPAAPFDLEEKRRRWLANPLFAPAMRIPAVATRLRAIIGDYSGWHWMNSDSDYFPSPSVYERLETISAPTLAIVGEWDLPDFRGIAETIGRRVPGARHVVIPAAGHMANMERPDAVNDVISAFLGRR
jgi:pimeloyl-ACP methyl ester carboxylesterase